jgi:hemoglobin-like flavoprotein
MPLNVPLLRSSFELVIDRQPQLTHRFYEILFQRYPQAKALFTRNSPTTQEKMLNDALVAVLDHLEDAPWLSANLRALGARHVGYGVTADMYDWVGASLLATLAEAGGPYWTPQLASAWTDAFAAIARLMQAGADDVQAPA